MSSTHQAAGGLNNRTPDSEAVALLVEALAESERLELSAECVAMLVAVGRHLTAFEARRVARATGCARRRVGER